MHIRFATRFGVGAGDGDGCVPVRKTPAAGRQLKDALHVRGGAYGWIRMLMLNNVLHGLCQSNSRIVDER